MADPVLRMKVNDSQDIRLTIKEDRQVIPGEGFTITVTVATSPATSVSVAGAGSSTVVTIPRNAITAPGLYAAEISADNGAKRKTKTFKVRAEAHP